MKKIGYVGTYDENQSAGIYRFEIDNGVLSDESLFASIKNAKYLKYYQNKLIALGDFSGGSGVALLDHSGNVLDHLVYEQKTACFVDCQADYIYTANYHEGSVSKIAISDNKLRFVQKLIIEEGAGCHQVLFYHDLILVPCLLLDEVRVFDQNLNLEGIINFPQGFGCRHGVFSLDEHWLYIVGELSDQVAVVDLTQMKIVKFLSLLKDDETSYRQSAAIRISKDGKTLFVSTRGRNTITVIGLFDCDLWIKQTFSVEGDHPRDILIDDDYLLVANRYSNELISFKIHDGYVEKEFVSKIKLPAGIAIAMEK